MAETAKHGFTPEQLAWLEKRFNAIRPAVDRGFDRATIMRIVGGLTALGVTVSCMPRSVPSGTRFRPTLPRSPASRRSWTKDCRGTGEDGRTQYWNPTAQVAALEAAGCTMIRTETGSGTTLENRPELGIILDFIHPGETLVVTRIDRLARSMKDLQVIVAKLRERGANIAATEQPVDTSTAAGKAFPDHGASRKTEARRPDPGPHDGLQPVKGYNLPLRR